MIKISNEIILSQSMSKLVSPKHPIQHYIVTYLSTHESAHFIDMKPQKVATNLFTYHLKVLVENDFIRKNRNTYYLTQKGCGYIFRASQNHPELSARAITKAAFIIQDGYGKLLVRKRDIQPGINRWELPSGDILADDYSIELAARRICYDSFRFDPHVLRHVGDCYVTVLAETDEHRDEPPGGHMVEGELIKINGEKRQIVESKILLHVIRIETDAIVATSNLQWIEPLAMSQIPLAPAVEQIVTRAFFGDDFFFEEFTEQAT
ncbi:hypothetical protein IPP24_01080 [Candidatus Saccharibacteria bacterium]|nr:MAG: hypothetical protein IPP24_01080 [Candidatus Saccharibacteria bacterium]